MSSEPLTRQDVEQRCLDWVEGFGLPTHYDDLQVSRSVTAALLAMAECKHCKGTGVVSPDGFSEPQPCLWCDGQWQPPKVGTGLNQAALARGLAALRETK